MAERSSPASPIQMSPVQTLLVGDIVSVGVKLYEANFRDYLKLAWKGTLWAVLPYASAIAVILFFTITRSFYSLLGLLIPALIVLFFYCLARYLSYTALLSRLAFGELIEQPEAIEDARRYTQRRQWSFLLSSFLLSLVYLGVGLPIYLIMVIVFFAMLAAIGGVAIFQNPSPDIGPAVVGAVLSFLLLFFVLFVVLLVVFLWLSGRLVSHDVPLAVEPGATAAQSIGRMWQLTKRSAWRMVFILTIAFCVTLPVQIMTQLVSALADRVLEVFVPENVPTYNLLSALIATVIGFGFAIVLLPFWQAVRSVIYCDLRNRREGFGLQLRDRDELASDELASDELASDLPPRPTFSRFFRRVTLATPESVELEFTLAGIGRRAQALFVDYQLMALILIGFWIFWWLFSLGLLISLSQTTGNYASVPLWLVAIAVLISFVIYTGYFAFFEVFWQGQTPGKRVAQIRVICDDGRPIGLTQAVLRSLVLLADTFLYMGVFFMLFNQQEKRLGDMAAGTLVVQEQRPPRKEMILISAPAEQLAAELPTKADLGQLSTDDFAVLHAYLQRRVWMDTQVRNERSLQLARQLRSIIQLETIPPNTVSDHFLEAVYLAYQQQGESYDK